MLKLKYVLLSVNNTLKNFSAIKTINIGISLEKFGDNLCS